MILYLSKYSLLSAVILFIFLSCHGQSSTSDSANIASSSSSQAGKEPNFKYVTVVPEDWMIYDTVMSGLNIRHLLPTLDSEGDAPRGNILITAMNGKDITCFTNDNINYLKSNMSGIKILEKGVLDSSAVGGEWFTYTKDQDGSVRDMINYILPYKGFAYMVTLGSRSGTMDKYRLLFDGIARSVNPQ